MNYIYTTLLSAVIIFTIGCTTDNKISIEAETKPQQSTTIMISDQQFESSGMLNGKLSKKHFDKTIIVNGKVSIPSKSKAIVSSIMSGTIGAIDLIEGQWINKNQALFTVTNIELIDLQEEYLILQSKMEYLREEEIRKQKLVAENLIPKQELLLSQSEYLANQAKHKTVAKKLKMYGVDTNNLSINKLNTSLTIYSPISGYVSNINALRGQFINPSTEVLTIENKSMIYLSLNVLERDALLIDKGQNITFSVTGSLTKYNATVHLISPKVSDKGMMTVHCKITDVKDLIPGMYATAEMTLESYETNALPESAVVQIEGENNILILTSELEAKSNYEPQVIEVGANKNGYLEIKNSDPWLDQTILVKGGYYLVN